MQQYRSTKGNSEVITYDNGQEYITELKVNGKVIHSKSVTWIDQAAKVFNEFVLEQLVNC